MNLNEIKDLMAQFDQSSLKNFLIKMEQVGLVFSKNEAKLVAETSLTPQPVVPSLAALQTQLQHQLKQFSESNVTGSQLKESHLSELLLSCRTEDKPRKFCSVGDTVKGQTLVIIEAMKVMNEIPAPKDVDRNRNSCCQ